jgi:hypothetical protein
MTALRHRAALAAFSLAACGAPPPAVAEPWPAADNLFQRDPRWLGGDAVYSVDLGDDRVLWLFGDSFVAPDGLRDRRTSTMVRNTIAVQRGRDPARATIAFHWRTAGGKPAPFFANDGALGCWPLHGVRVPGGPLLLFQTLVRETPGQGLGFAIDGWRLVRIDGADGDPDAWRMRSLPLGDVPRDAILGTAAWLRGDHVEVLGTRGNGPHRGVLARLQLRDLDAARVPFEVWCDGRWQPCASGCEPDEVLADAGPECSVHAAGSSWLHVYSRGFGATTVAAHTATAPQGPWSPARELFVPPESSAPRAFVYAAKAHPELDAGAGWLAVSYAANALDFADLFTPAGQRSLYWPRFWRVPAPR